MGKREKVSSFRIVGHFNFYESDFCPQAGKLGSIALDSFAMWTGPGANKQMSRKKAARTVLENREREGERQSEGDWKYCCACGATY